MTEQAQLLLVKTHDFPVSFLRQRRNDIRNIGLNVLQDILYFNCAILYFTAFNIGDLEELSTFTPNHFEMLLLDLVEIMDHAVVEFFYQLFLLEIVGLKAS